MSRLLHAMPAPIEERAPEQMTSIGNIKGHYEAAMIELRKVAIGEDFAKRGLLIALISGGNIALVGGPGGSKSTLMRNINNTVDGMDENVQITANAYTRGTELIGSQTDITSRNKTTGQKDIMSYITEAKLSEGTTSLFIDEANHMTPEALLTLTDGLSDRFIEVNGNRIYLPSLQYMATGMNPRKPQSGQYKIKDSIPSRFGLGVLLGLKQDDRTEDEIDTAQFRGFNSKHNVDSKERQVRTVMDTDELAADRRYIQESDEIVVGASLERDAINKIRKAQVVLDRELQTDEGKRRMIPQAVSNIRTISAFKGEKDVTPETVDEGIAYMVGSRVGMLAARPSKKLPEILSEILAK